MPYIAIKAFPKDEDMKIRIVERINQALLEEWGCSATAITISLEEIAPAEWKEKVEKAEIEPNRENMMILSGVKTYEK